MKDKASTAEAPRLATRWVSMTRPLQEVDFRHDATTDSPLSQQIRGDSHHRIMVKRLQDGALPLTTPADLVHPSRGGSLRRALKNSWNSLPPRFAPLRILRAPRRNSEEYSNRFQFFLSTAVSTSPRPNFHGASKIRHAARSTIREARRYELGMPAELMSATEEARRTPFRERRGAPPRSAQITR